MLVIKQNGRNKLGRTGNGIHMETNKKGHCVQCGRLWSQRLVQLAVLILNALCCPLACYPFSGIPLPGACRAPGKGTQTENSWKGLWNEG